MTEKEKIGQLLLKGNVKKKGINISEGGSLECNNFVRVVSKNKKEKIVGFTIYVFENGFESDSDFNAVTSLFKDRFKNIAKDMQKKFGKISKISEDNISRGYHFHICKLGVKLSPLIDTRLAVTLCREPHRTKIYVYSFLNEEMELDDAIKLNFENLKSLCCG